MDTVNKLFSFFFAQPLIIVFLFQWFLDRMADDNWWPMQILIKCPNQIVRQVRDKS